MSAKVVLHTDPIDHPLDEDLQEAIKAAGGALVGLDPQTDKAYAAHAPDAIAVLNSDFRLTAERLALLQRCRVISRFGIGVDNIDVAAATAQGIIVTNVPGFCTEEVADRTWLLLLACACDLLGLDRRVRGGEWREKGLVLSMPIAEHVLGLIGLGRIGLAVARRAQASKMIVVGYDPFISGGQMARHGIERAELDDLLKKADFLAITCPLTEETRRLIDARRMGLMKRTAVLVNCARGAIIDQAALVEALKARRIAVAGLDVFDPEPPGKDNPLYHLDNVILTPHSAATTPDAMRRLRRQAAESVIRVFRGERPANAVIP